MVDESTVKHIVLQTLATFTSCCPKNFSWFLAEIRYSSLKQIAKQLFSSLKSTLHVVSILGSSVQQRHGLTGTRPAKGHKDEEGIGVYMRL